MLNRRSLIGATLALAFTGAAQAQTRPSEIVFAVIPSENASGVTERYGPFVEYLSKELGTKVTLRIANDYAAVIEGQRAGNIHIAYYGPSSYVRAATVTNGNVVPFVTSTNSDGSVGYYSVLYTRAGNSAGSLQDLKGKNLCLVDPNSTSGNNVPRFAMNKMGINPDAFFGKVVYAGSHENAITAVQQGTCDGAFNWWNSDTDSNFQRMVNKGMVKRDDFKIVFRSEMIPGSPYAFLDNLPADTKAAITKAFVEAPQKDKAAFDRLSDGKDLGFTAVTAKDYETVVELQRFVDSLRRARS
jgi:phosphonate transport system substrate-binding protein